MKINLEFEKEDFYNMLRMYFADKNWIALNLNDVVEQFGDAFPGGMIVQAEMVQDDTSSVERPAAVREAPKAEVLDENPRLSTADLMDPENEQEEFARILAESSALKNV